jgi:hypothetical protein
MHSIFIKSEITFGGGVKCTLYTSAKASFSAIFFSKKILPNVVEPIHLRGEFGRFTTLFSRF